MKSELAKLANTFQIKLGLETPPEKEAEFKLPKALKKLAQVEQKLQEKVAKERAKFAKVAAGPTVKCSFGSLPASYHICEACQGQGKIAANKVTGLLSKCASCKGKRIIKAVNDSQCSEEQLLSYAAEKEEKEQAKKAKKGEKLKKKLTKTARKAAEKRLALEDPEKYAAVKAEKKDLKSKKKALKKAKKAEKKAMKAKAKAEKFFGQE